MKTVNALFALCGVFVANAAAQDALCAVDGGRGYRHQDLGGGTTRVIEQYYSVFLDTIQETPKLDVTRAELQAYYQGLLRDSALVFIASIDSVIQLGSGDTAKPLAPWKTLAADSMSGRRYFRFYARVKVDTVLKGSLPSAFWIEGKRQEACQFDWKTFKGKGFLNASGAFEKMTDLKVDLARSLDAQRAAHWFDGRFLSTPPFYGVRLDITHVLSDYPATGIAPRRPAFVRPAASGRSYLPDGRAARALDARTHPVPVLKLGR